MQESTDGALNPLRWWRRGQPKASVDESEKEILTMDVEESCQAAPKVPGRKLIWIGRSGNRNEDEETCDVVKKKKAGIDSPVRTGTSRRLFTQGISQRRIRGKWQQEKESSPQELESLETHQYAARPSQTVDQSHAAALKIQQEDMRKYLFYAVESGDCSLVKSLCLNGASLEWVNAEGMTPLMVSCSQERLFNMVLTLIKLGSHPTGATGGYALHEAASNGLVNTVALLLSCGADPLMANDGGQTSLDVAREKRHVAIVRIIEDWICYFGGYLRELHTSKSSPGKKLVSKKVWAVVLPTCSTSSGSVMRNELVLYASRKANTPIRVILLGKFTSEIKEPNWEASDPQVTIMDKVSKCENRFRAEMRGDKDQLKKLYEACTQVEGQAQMLSVYQNLSPGVRSPEDIALTIAMKTSIQTALQEGIPLSKMLQIEPFSSNSKKKKLKEC